MTDSNQHLAPSALDLADWSYGDEARQWMEIVGQSLADEVDRLWPEETDPAYRAACLAEEAGEVKQGHHEAPSRLLRARRQVQGQDRGRVDRGSMARWRGYFRPTAPGPLLVPHVDRGVECAAGRHITTWDITTDTYGCMHCDHKEAADARAT